MYIRWLAKKPTLLSLSALKPYIPIALIFVILMHRVVPLKNEVDKHSRIVKYPELAVV